MASAEHGSGNRGELHGCTKTTIGITNKSSIQNTRECRQYSAEDENTKLDSVYFNSTRKTRRPVPTNRQNSITKRGCERQKMKHHQTDQNPNHSSINLAKITATKEIVGELLANRLGGGERKT